MCGRYVAVTPVPVLASFFSAAFSPDIEQSFQRSWNVPPTSSVLAITESPDRERAFCRLRWGLVPPWAKELSFGANTINARAETIATKPSFRSAFLSQRCIIPADGYFEWKTTAGELKQPYYFSRSDNEPLGFAGIWEAWRQPGRDRSDDNVVFSCAIVTTEASADVDEIHNRMPVLLELGAAPTWLDPDNHDREELLSLLKPAPRGTLVRSRVGRSVGSTRNDDPTLIEEVLDSPALF